MLLDFFSLFKNEASLQQTILKDMLFTAFLLLSSFACKTLTVLDSANGDISYPDNINACSNTTISISPTGSTTGFSFLWSPVSGGIIDPSLPVQDIDFTNTTTYTVEITNNDTGCSITETIEITALPDPVANFTTEAGCEQGLEIDFIKRSQKRVSYRNNSISFFLYLESTAINVTEYNQQIVDIMTVSGGNSYYNFVASDRGNSNNIPSYLWQSNLETVSDTTFLGRQFNDLYYDDLHTRPTFFNKAQGIVAFYDFNETFYVLDRIE